MNEYKTYTSQALAEEIKNTEHFRLEMIQECFNRNNPQLTRVLELKAHQNDELKELIRSLEAFPLKAGVLYYPNQDRVKLFDISNFAEVHIPEKTKKKLKALDTEEDFYLKLSVEQVPGEMFHYRVFEKAVNEKNFIMSGNIGNAIVLTSILAASITFFQDKTVNKAEASIPRLAHHQEFISAYDAVMHDLRKGGMKVNPANDLKESDLRLISSLVEEEEDEDAPPVLAMSESEIISNIEDVISPYIKEKGKVTNIAKSIYDASLERKVDYLLFLSIMKVETTTFNQDAVSSSGDLSIAQIKPEVWSDEFARLGKAPLDVTRLKKDPSYAIGRMGEILELQNKYKEKDPYWYARYHSKTPSRKLKYAKKVQQEYLRIKERQIIELEEKIANLLVDLDKVEGTKFDISFSYARHALMDRDKIEQHKEELKKIQKVIQENKFKKMKEFVAQL